MRSDRLDAAGLLALALSVLGACAPSRTASSFPPPPPSVNPPVAAETPAPTAKPAFTVGYPELLRARELSPLPKQVLAAGKLTGEVEGAAVPTVEPGDTSTRVTIPIGTGDTIDCFLYPSDFDPANQLSKVFAALASKFDVKVARLTDVVVVGDDAALFAEAEYVVSDGAGGKAVGQVKAMAVDTAVAPMLCLHDELGYEATFKRITLGLESSMKREGSQDRPPRSVQIFVARIEGAPTGFVRNIALDGEHGTTLHVSKQAQLISESGSQTAALDTVEIETDDKGTLTKGHYVEDRGGTVVENMVLERVSPREYTYEGTHKGAALSGKFTSRSPQGVASGAHEDVAARKLLASGGADVRMEKYDASGEAKATIDLVVHLVSKAERKLTVGTTTVQVTEWLDADGRVEKVEGPAGAAKLSFERIYIRGSE